MSGMELEYTDFSQDLEILQIFDAQRQLVNIDEHIDVKLTIDKIQIIS